MKNLSTKKNEIENNKEAQVPLDLEEIDAADDDLVLPLESELTKKVVVRRKIEMYWEKKRLQEEIGNFGEIDFDF